MEPWNFYEFPFSWECHHPNCYSLHHFSEGLTVNHQPDTDCRLHVATLEICDSLYDFPIRNGLSVLRDRSQDRSWFLHLGGAALVRNAIRRNLEWP